MESNKFLRDFPFEEWSTSEIHCLLKQTDAENYIDKLRSMEPVSPVCI